ATGVDYETAEKFFEEAKRNVKAAITTILLNCSYDEAVEKLKKAKGFIRKTL
ncbi:MAG: N-acetylmuramic acid 6-phosphate etherase, partial [Bacillaceae bacterium]|nr:N-acetylmuramic acid 6-phosphate etherase [Bacillaceae bacterium]